MTEHANKPHRDQFKALLARIPSKHGEVIAHTAVLDDFDRMIQSVEAAAEQRGAEQALREAATAIEKNQVIIDGDHFQPCNSCMSIHMQFLDHRADQIEGTR